MDSRAPPDQIDVSTSIKVFPQLKVATKGHVPASILDACVVTSLILVVVLCICLVWETREWTGSVAEQAELNAVEAVAGDMRRALEGLHAAITATSKGLQQPGLQELPAVLRQLVLFGFAPQMNHASEIYLIGADGVLRDAADDLAPPAVSFSDRAYFDFHRTHADTAVLTSGPLVGRLTGEPVVVLSKRVNDRQGHFAGIVAGSINLSFFYELFKKFDLRDGRIMDLSRIDGLVIARTPASPRMVSANMGNVGQGVSGAYTGISRIDGIRRLVAYRRIDGFPFVVSYERPTREIYAQWTKGSLVIGGALLVLSTLAMVMIGELRRERRRRALAERSAWRSAHDLAIANADLEQRIRREVQSRKETQEKLAKSQRLEALGQLAGGIAHDINNVLQTVTGACTLVQTHDAENDDVQRLTTIAISAADRGSAVTQRLLLFARRADIKAENINTAMVLDDLQELLNHTLNDSIVLKLDLPANVPDVIADRMQLETVIINLATNARDAMPEGGTITIAARADFVGENDNSAGLSPGRYVRLSVADTGIGMDEHIQARAAEPFFSTKGAGKGTGLGLSMAKGFAEQSKGKFAITSRVGAGTTVSLWLPAGEESHASDFMPAQPPKLEANSNLKRRMLVVDDNAEARELVGEWLVASGFEVQCAASGEEALSTVKAGLGLDLLLTDLSMPGIDGLRLIRQLRGTIPGLPAIVLTGDTSAVAGLATEDALADGCLVLQKPIRLTELVHHIEIMLCVGSAQSDGGRPGGLE